MEKTKIIGTWVGIIFGIVSTIAIFLTGLNWIIRMHTTPINTNIASVKTDIASVKTDIKSEIKNLKENDLKHITDDIKDIKELLKRK